MLSEILPVQTCCACNDVTLMQAAIITNPAIFFMSPSSLTVRPLPSRLPPMGQIVVSNYRTGNSSPAGVQFAPMKMATGVCAFAIALVALRAAPLQTVSTLVGTGVAGYGDEQVNNPYGLVLGPDRVLYFCDLDNQRVRRLHLATKRVTSIAGNGQKGYSCDGGLATSASLNMPHEIRFDRNGDLYIAERDNHVIRKVNTRTGIISTVAGTGKPGFSGDGGQGTSAELRQPHSIIVDRDGALLVCDIGNQRIRRLHLDTGVIETYAGTGEAKPTPDGAPVSGTPLNGPRTMALAPNGDLYLALREGNMILRIDRRTDTFRRVAGTGAQGYGGDGGPAPAAELGGPKGLAP